MGRRWLALPVFLLALPGGVAADGIDDYLAREMALRKIPGLAVAVARDGEVVRVSSYGLANVETGTPVTRRVGLRHRVARQAGDRCGAGEGGRARQARTRRSGFAVGGHRPARRDAAAAGLPPLGAARRHGAVVRGPLPDRLHQRAAPPAGAGPRPDRAARAAFPLLRHRSPPRPDGDREGGGRAVVGFRAPDALRSGRHDDVRSRWRRRSSCRIGSRPTRWTAPASWFATGASTPISARSTPTSA